MNDFLKNIGNINLSLVIVLITNIVNIGLLFFVLSKRNQNTNRRSIFAFAGSIATLVLWSTSNYLADTSTAVPAALFWTRATFPFALFMCWFIFYFSYVFPLRKKEGRTMVLFYFILVCLFSFISFTPFIIARVGINTTIGISEISVGPLYIYVVCMYLILIGHTTINFIRTYARTSGQLRLQMRYVIIGWGSFLFFAVFTNAILPLLTGNANWSKFGPLGSVVMIIAIAYAIARYDFLDVKIIIQRGIVYSLLLMLIIGVYIALLFAGNFIFDTATNTDAVISAFVTTLIGIFGVPHLKAFFQRVTARVFFKDRYDYATVLGSLAEVLNENLLKESIIKKTTEILRKSIKMQDVVFWMQAAPYTHANECALSIAILSNKKSVGTLYLGEKLSGDRYTTEDMILLNTFCVQAGVALEKAELYAQVQEYAKNLEHKVAERTAEIQRMQKEQESMMLEISHGLQTPLTIMKGELFFLKKQGYEPLKIDTIDSSINRVSFFIKRLLDLYRLDTTVLVEPHEVYLRELVLMVKKSFQSEIHASAIEIQVTAPHDVVVCGDSHGIEEVLSNLVSNAIKYTEKGKLNRIEIALSSTDTHAQIVIKDTAVGIRTENIPNLFKKFYRVKNAETKGVSGTGLGLAICKKIVEMHDGSLAVMSEFGKGTVFTITLPKACIQKIDSKSV
jgi:signal transduction histidine kinase